MPPPTAVRFLPQATAIAAEAGNLLMPFFERRIGFEYKGDVDLVTEADRASEQLIVSRLRAAWPDHDIVGEEGTRDSHGGDFRWYVDPLDGTTNFAHGLSGLLRLHGTGYRGPAIAGILYDPTRDELFAAAKGAARH